MNNPIDALSKVSKNPKWLLARGIAKTVEALGNDNNLRERILGLIDGKVVLTPDELTLIEDALTSQEGGAAMNLVNNRLFTDFQVEKSRRNTEFGEQIISSTENFVSEWGEDTDSLHSLADGIKKFARAKRVKFDAINAPEIWKYLKTLQKEAIRQRNNTRFRESCLDGTSRILSTWERDEKKRDENGIEQDIPYTLEVRHDPDNNLIGGWDSRGRILGDSVISGHRPIDELPWFITDDYILPCTDAMGNLTLIEFDPSNFRFLWTLSPYFRTIANNNIWTHGTISTADGKGEIFYCRVSDGYKDRIISVTLGEKCWASMPLENVTNQVRINGDVIYIFEGDGGSFPYTHIYSVQTGGTLSLKNRHIEERETRARTENKSEDIIWTLRARQDISWTLHTPTGWEADWSLSGFFNKTIGARRVSLLGLQQAWRNAAIKAKTHK